MTQRSSADAPLDLLLARREWVRRFARTLARDDSSADDLAQDAFVTAIERPPETLDRPGGWLRRVLTTRAMDIARAARRRDAHETRAAKADAAPDVADVVGDAEGGAESREVTIVLPKGVPLSGRIETPPEFALVRAGDGVSLASEPGPVVTVASELTGRSLGATRADEHGRFSLLVAPTPGVAQRVVVWRHDIAGESWRGESLASSGDSDVVLRLVKQPPAPIFGARAADAGTPRTK